MTLYVLTNQMMGLHYVGATTQSLPKRLSEHRQRAFTTSRPDPICEAIRRDGWEAFTVHVLAEPTSKVELMHLEAQTIAELGCFYPHGYNYTTGGLGTPNRPCGAETRAKMAARKKDYVPWNAGLKTGPLSRAHRRKLSAAQKGRVAWNRGIPHSHATRKRMAAAHQGAKNYNAKVVEFNGKRYPSGADAMRALGWSRMQLVYRIQKGVARYVSE